MSDNGHAQDVSPPLGGRWVPSVQRVGFEEAGCAVATLIEAFENDPVSAWVYPSAVDRRRQHAAMFRVFVDVALSVGEVHATDDFTGVALWMPSSEVPDDLGGRVVDGLGEGPHRFIELGHRMDDAHPADAHMYLPFIGVLPPHHGRGHGSALLGYQLARLDWDASPAYLEASSQASARLYASHGFGGLGPAITLARGVEMTPMWRMPSSTTAHAADGDAPC